jgi:predicted nucleic acid-binding protein
VRFWDASAVVPLLIAETSTRGLRALLAEDPQMSVWALTPVEVLSALWRRRRLDELDTAALRDAEASLQALEPAWNVVLDVERVERRARRLLAAHAVRVADAVQLAAATVACEERTDLLPFVTLDDRLAEAARREGFRVLPH